MKIKNTILGILIISLSIFTNLANISANDFDNAPLDWAFDETSRSLETTILSTYPTVDINSDGYISISEANQFSPVLNMMRLSKKNISGTLNGIEHFKKLIILDLSGNQLEGPLPENIGNLKSLGTLMLSSNQLSGSVPNSFTEMSSLTQFKLNDNQFSGQLPENIGDLTKLTYLDVESNNFSGDLPSSFQMLSKLTRIDLRYNDFTGNLPNIETMTNLATFVVSHNHFSGEIPESFKTNNSITLLDLHQNMGLVGDTADIFKTNTHLKYLDVRHTNMNQEKPQLTTLDVENGGFFGHDLLDDTETGLLDFVTQDHIDEMRLGLVNVSDAIAKEDINVYLNKTQAMLDAKLAVHSLLANDMLSLNDSASYELYDEATVLVGLINDGILKDELSLKLDLVKQMLDVQMIIIDLFDENNHLKLDYTQNDIDTAFLEVENLHDSETKLELFSEIDRAQIEYDQRIEAIKSVEELFVEDIIIDDVTLKIVNSVEDMVMRLPDSILKDELLELVDDARRQVDEREYHVVENFGLYTGKELMTTTLDGPYRLFDKVYVNDIPLDEGYYEVKEGSTIITLLPNYLNTLENGTYHIRYTYKNDEEVLDKFEVKFEEEQKPNPGEELDPEDDKEPKKLTQEKEKPKEDQKNKNPLTGIEDKTFVLVGVLAVAAVALFVLFKKKSNK